MRLDELVTRGVRLPPNGLPVGCLIWQGAKTKDGGYGLTKLTGRGRKTFYVHRVAFEVATGLDPAGLCVCHECDTPACFEASHLFLGTIADNNADRHAKGRSHAPRGSANARAVLTEVIVTDLRRRARSGARTSDMARELAVAAETVRGAINGSTWRHVTEPPVVSRRLR